MDFNAAYEGGRKHVGRLMILFVRDREGAPTRLGVVTGRKIGCAVVRNRCRRRLREAFRRNRTELKTGCDVVLLARRGVDAAPWDQVNGEFLSLATRAGLIRKPTQGAS